MSISSVPLRVLLDDLDQPVLVEAAVAHGDLLVHGIEAAERGDHMRAVGRDEAVRHRAAGLQQFARHRDVDVADAGRERQHRPLAAELARRHRQNFDVIGGGAGALRDAGDRGALHRETGLRRRRHDPVVSTPPPSPPSAAISMVMGRERRSCRRLACLAAIAAEPADHLLPQADAATRSRQVALRTISAR